MKNKLKKAVILGTVGTTAVSSTLSQVPANSLYVKAESVSKEGTSNVVTPDTPSENEGIVSPEVPTATPTNTPTPTEGVVKVSLDDIRSVGEFTGNAYVKENGTVYYKDVVGLNLSATCLNEKVAISSIRVYTNTSELANTQGGYVSIKNIVNVNALSSAKVEYSMSNGQVLTQSLLEALKGMTGNLSDIVQDAEAPSINLTDNTFELKNNYIVKDGSYVFTVSDMGSGIKDFFVEEISNEETSLQFTTNKDTGELVFDTNQFDEGTHTIKVYAIDNVENTSEYELSFSIIRSTPEITGKSISETISLNGKVYSKGDITCKLDGYNNSKIVSIELCKDGNVIQKIKQGTFSISENGSYSVKVTDVLDGTKVYTLNGLFSEVVSSDVVIDKTNPIVTKGTFTTTEKIGYITKDGNMVFSVKDIESGIKDVKVTLKNSDKPVAFTYKENTSTLSINSSQFDNGDYSIVIDVSDNVGNKTSYGYEFKVLKVAPSIQGIEHSDVINKNNDSYSTKEVSLTVAGYEDTRIESIKLYKDGVEYKAFVNGVGVISESGDYSVVVRDIVDNVTEYKLTDLFSDMNSSVKVDTEKPTCIVNLNGKGLPTNWVTDMTKLEFIFADNYDLKNATVTVNGKDFNYGLEGKTVEKVIDLSKDVTQPNDGIYNIMVSCSDFAGNSNVVESLQVKVDLNDPTFGTVKAKGNIVETNNRVYLEGSLKVSGTCYDIGSGVKSVELLRGEEVVATGLPFSISESGEYTLRVTDNAGRTSTKTLKEFMGTNSNVLIVDNEAPTVTRVSGFTPDKVEEGVNWYKSCPIINYTILDENMKTVSIKVNGKEKVHELSETGTYLVNTEGYEGAVVVEVKAEDYFGHVTTDKYNYSVDKDIPTITSVELTDEYTSRGGVVFFKSAPSIKVEAIDKGIGLDSYNLSGAKTLKNTTGLFKLGTGEFFLEVKDKLGNTTGARPLKDLLGLPSNQIIVDTEAPTIKGEKPKGAVNNWYANDVNYKINLADNQGIKSATVKVNGKVVSEYLSKDIYTTSATVYADTSKVKADEKGMYQISVSVVDNTGNTKSWSDYLYIDSTKPKVEKFVFTGDGIQEGVNIGGSAKKYGFYFKGEATCEILVSDGEISSGLDKLYVTLETYNGKKTTKKVNVSGGTAKINLPKNFKGFISAYATDKVGNKGNVARPDGVIVEDSNCFMNSVSIDIALPSTEYQDIKGMPLYNSDVSATATISSDYAGIRSVSWGIGSKTIGTVKVDNNGKVSGGATISKKDKNLVLSLSNLLSIQGNTNDMELWVSVEDRTGRTSKSVKKLSIDKDVPTISVVWDKTSENGYYKENRVATVTVEERNFDASKFTISGNSGTLGTWSNKDNVWTNTITFAEDGEYSFSLDCTDRAGNIAKTYSSEKFTVDKTTPIMTVTWDNETPNNEGFYNKARKATISVVDKSFDASKMSIQGSGSASSWTSVGDTHTTVVSFTEDGEHELSVSGEDLAGNLVEPYTSGKFIIDTSTPTLEISGVQNGVSYKGDVKLSVKVSDNYLDKSNTSIVLKGKRNKDITLKGTMNEKTGEFTIEEFPKEEAYDDIYTLNALVVDKAGNKVEETLVFSVNRFGSTYEFNEETILGNYLNTATDITIVETNVDKLDTEKAKVVVTLDGKEFTVDDSNISIEEKESETGKYSYTYKIKKEAFKENGKYLVQVYSTSFDGTTYNSVSEEYAFVLDSVDPKIIVSGVEQGKKYHEYEKKVTIDIRDISGVDKISATLNGKEVVLNKENGVYSFNISESVSSQTLEVTVVDLAGNKSTSRVEDFMVTSNLWVYLINQWWFKVSIGTVVAFLGAIIALIVASRRKARKQEEATLRQNAELYRGSSSSSSSLNQEECKDLVEDLESDK